MLDPSSFTGRASTLLDWQVCSCDIPAATIAPIGGQKMPPLTNHRRERDELQLDGQAMPKHKSFADIKAATYAAPKPRKKGGRTIAGAEPSHRADRPHRASGGRLKRHPDVERHTTIIMPDPGIAGIAPPMPTATMIARRSVAAPVSGNHIPMRKGEAYGISSAAGSPMRRGGTVDHYSHNSIKRRLGQ